VAIVTGGLGQPEEGSLVAGGLGISETNPNALRAVLSGSGAIVGTLTDGGAPAPAPEPPAVGHVIRRPYRYLQPPPLTREPDPIPVSAVAHLSGSGRMTGRLDFTLDADYLAWRLAEALLLEMI